MKTDYNPKLSISTKEIDTSYLDNQPDWYDEMLKNLSFKNLNKLAKVKINDNNNRCKNTDMG